MCGKMALSHMTILLLMVILAQFSEAFLSIGDDSESDYIDSFVGKPYVEVGYFMPDYDNMPEFDIPKQDPSKKGGKLKKPKRQPVFIPNKNQIPIQFTIAGFNPFAFINKAYMKEQNNGYKNPNIATQEKMKLEPSLPYAYQNVPFEQLPYRKPPPQNMHPSLLRIIA